ncbi:transmembrane protein 141 isoform X1 [Notechis scutatus]|uniref:Transmembrane protein 141 isoform X1 n=1 Tax=Notechis scutatus TaxID=8663 RepID=A0A6J1VEQ5_9SAUR|nr:transmembrane protein 141 isoform X1 [Notechis scutatus]
MTGRRQPLRPKGSRKGEGSGSSWNKSGGFVDPLRDIPPSSFPSLTRPRDQSPPASCMKARTGLVIWASCSEGGQSPLAAGRPRREEAMPPDAAANPEYALCQAYVRLKGLAVLAVGTGAAFAVLRKPLSLPWSALFSLALVGLPTYAITRRQLKNCADLWDFQTTPSKKVAQR